MAGNVSCVTEYIRIQLTRKDVRRAGPVRVRIAWTEVGQVPGERAGVVHLVAQ
jgi:hypothetical protein